MPLATTERLSVGVREVTRSGDDWTTSRPQMEVGAGE